MTSADDLSATSPASRAVRPRIRTAAIVWGLIIGALGVAIAWFVLDPERVTSEGLRILASGPGGVALGAVGLLLVIGVVIVIGSVLSVVHRTQDRARSLREKAVVPVPAAPEPS